MSSERFQGRPLTGPDAPNWWFARLVQSTIGRLFLAMWRVDLKGWEHVPEGGAILAGNHVSHLDPVLLWCSTRRPAHFVAKIELWDIKLLGWFLDHVWAFPVRRGTADREMITTASNLLSGGELVGMFPEGTRSHDGGNELGEAHGGVAFLALRTGVPVVPVGIAGTERALPRGAKFPRLVPVTVRYGEPVHPDAFEGTRKEKMELMTAEIMRRIAAVRDEARGAQR